jgi:LytS/YehU family sensor histidine kinase
LSPTIYFYNQLIDITGRSAVILIIAFVISHLIIKNNFNIIHPGIKEKFLLSLTFILIYTFTLLFNYGNENLLIFDLALPIVIVSGILGGLQVSFLVSAIAAIEINFFFPLSWPYAILTIIAGIASGLIHYIQKSNNYKTTIASIMQFVFSILQISIVYYIFEGYLYHDLWQNILSAIIVALVQVASVIIFLYIIYSIIDFQKQQQELTLQNQYRLKTLQSQLNPHFLFNSLNTIGSLTRTNPNKAHELIIELSSLLRSSLRTQGELVPLVDEMQNINNYLAIAQARFGDRIIIKKDIPEIYFRFLVPNLIWEPVIENAIIHNIKLQDKVQVSIAVKKDQQYLYLITSDNGQGISQDKLQDLKSSQPHHKHLGLPSTIARLKNQYQKENLVNINTSGKGTIITLKIPTI